MIKLTSLLESLSSDYEFLSPDEASMNGYNFYDELNRIEKESGINILSDKELNVIVFFQEKPVAALYTGTNSDEYSFDVIVDKPFQKQGIATKLINMALGEASEMREAGYELKLDVVNPYLVKHLLKKGLKILDKKGNHTIMGY